MINASINNPHTSFKFNFHAKSVSHYKYLIKNFSKLKKNLKYEEVFQFYYMHYINTNKNFFFDNLELFLKEIGGYHNLSSFKVYKEWMKKFNETKKEKIFLKLEKFIESDNLVLNNFQD